MWSDLISNPFLLRGLAAGALAAIACGAIGPYVVSRRIVFLAGAIAHIAVGGVGAAVWLAWALPSVAGFVTPLVGATVAAVAAAVFLAIASQRARERVDTLIGALWAVGMSAGIALARLVPGYQPELLGYLFGNVSMVSREAVWFTVVLVVLVIAGLLILHKRLLAMCIDQQQAELQGISVLGTEIALLVLVALTVVALTQVVGLILVIALLSLPAATAAHHAHRLTAMIAIAVPLCLVLVTLPRFLAYGSRLAPESAIVCAAAVVYLGSLAWRKARSRRKVA
jgi:zinc transport system permease protein